jgi:hypothetical protein
LALEKSGIIVAESGQEKSTGTGSAFFKKEFPIIARGHAIHAKNFAHGRPVLSSI